jgi:hypothetical protein
MSTTFIAFLPDYCTKKVPASWFHGNAAQVATANFRSQYSPQWDADRNDVGVCPVMPAVQSLRQSALAC